MFSSLFICLFTGTWLKESGINRCEMVQVTHFVPRWTKSHPSPGCVSFFKNSIFFCSISCRCVPLWQILWVKSCRLPSTLVLEPGVTVSQLPCVFLAEIFALGVSNTSLTFCPSRSAHRHHRAISGTQCPFDIIKKTPGSQLTHKSSAHISRSSCSGHVAEATQLLDITSKQKVTRQKHPGGTFKLGSSHNKQSTL